MEAQGDELCLGQTSIGIACLNIKFWDINIKLNIKY